MKNIFIVNPEQLDLARYFELVVLKLPKEGGILFASASIIEGRDGWDLSAVIGCSRSMEISAVEALIWQTIAKEEPLNSIKERIKIQVYRGVAKDFREGVDILT